MLNFASALMMVAAVFILGEFMPLYEYECKKCHHRFERIQTFSAPHT